MRKGGQGHVHVLYQRGSDNGTQLKGYLVQYEPQEISDNVSAETMQVKSKHGFWWQGVLQCGQPLGWSLKMICCRWLFIEHFHKIDQQVFEDDPQTDYQSEE